MDPAIIGHTVDIFLRLSLRSVYCMASKCRAMQKRVSCNPPSVFARSCDSSMNLTRKVAHNKPVIFYSIHHKEIAAKMLGFRHLSTAENLCVSLMSWETMSIDKAQVGALPLHDRRGISSLSMSRWRGKIKLRHAEVSENYLTYLS